MTATICSEDTFSVTPSNSINGLVPAGTEYVWTIPTVTGGLTGGTAGSGTSISGILINPTNSTQTATYTVTPITGSCVGSTFTVTVTVNPKPTITPITSAVCTGQTFTVTPITGTNGIVPSGTTYTWTIPAVTGGVTGGASGSGASIQGTLINLTNTVQTATYTVTPTSGTCLGNSFTVTVSVNPSPTIPAQNATNCSGSAFTVSPTNAGATIVPVGTTYTWTVADNPNVTGESAQGTAQSTISQTLTNTTPVIQTVTYTVTPTSGAAGNCVGTPFTVTVTVNPIPTLSSATSTSRCSNTSTTYTASSATPGTTFSWTRAVRAGISNTAGSGSGPAATETLINTTTNPVDVIYIYTLTANGCSTTQNVTVTVNPTPTLSSSLTPAAICNNAAFTYTPTSATTGTTFSWTRAAVTGISNAPVTTPQTSNPNEALVNTTATPLDVVYVFTLTADGCSNTQNVTVRVNPTPSLSSSLTPPAICSNSTYTYSHSSATTGAIITWTRAAVPGISNGPVTTAQTSNPNETLVNTTANPISVIYTYTITANGCTNSQNVAVTVNPLPSLTSTLTPAALCSNSAFTYSPTSATSGATFTWTRAAVAGISNGPVTTPQTSNPNETLVNTTTAPINVVYAYTVTANGCSTTTNVTVRVNPTPTLSTSLTPTAICSGSAFTYTPNSATSGATFFWTRAAVAGISNPAVTGPQTSNPNEILVNTTTSPIDVVYAYTITANGCSNTQNVTVRVNPTPALSSSLTPAAICSNSAFTYTPISATAGATITWTRAGVAGISNGPVSTPQTSNPNETLVNTTANPVSVVYAFTILANGCSSTQNVTVIVNPAPTLSSATTTNRCNDVSTTYTASSATPGTSFSWTRAAVAGISNAASSGSSATATETLVNTTANPINVVYVYTLSANGCSNTQNVTVTVNPSLTLTSTLLPAPVCSETPFTYTPTSATVGATFTWTRAAVAGISNPAVTTPQSTAINETLINTSASTIDVIYAITTTINGCSTTQNVTAKVVPSPNITPITLASCTGSPFSIIPTQGTNGVVPAGTTYTWTAPSVTGGITGGTAGSGGAVTGTLINPTNTPQTAAYTVTPSSSGCTGPTFTVTVTVNPNTAITTQPAVVNDQECFGDGFDPISVVAVGGNLSYQWYSNSTDSNSGGTPVPGATSATFTPLSSSIGVNYYYVEVIGACGVQVSQVSGRYEITPAVTTITTDLNTTAQTICPGGSFTPLSIVAAGADLKYQWYSNVTPSNTGGTLISGAIASSFTPPSSEFGPVYYYVIASSKCGSVSSSVSGVFAVTRATSSLPNQTVCVDEPLSPVITHTTTGTTGIGSPSGLPPGVTASWVNNTITISGTPTSAVGSPYNYSIPLIGACGTQVATGTITVNPKAVINNMTAVVCTGEVFTTTPANGTNGVIPAGTTYVWSAPVVTGGLTGGIAGSGTSLSGNLTNPTNSAQTATYTFTPTSGTCIGSSFTITVTVNPKTIIPAQTDTICSGSPFTVSPVNSGSTIVPTGTTYTWIVANNGNVTGETDQTAAQGNISQTLTNTSNTPQTVVYTVTPLSGTCAGTPFSVTVTVNPSPVIPAQTATTCSGSAFTVSPANGGATIVPSGTTYTWTVADNPNVTGETAQATATAAISQTLTNTSNVPQTVVYTVSPTSGAAGTCTGASFTVTVTVNPSPVIPSQTETICTGSAFTISPSNGGTTIVPSSTTYTWTVADNPNITGESAQTTAQSNVSQILTNTSNIIQTVTYTVTPRSGAAGNCVGAPFTVTITVNPTPTLSSTLTPAEICSNSAFSYTPTSATGGASITWTRAAVAGISNPAVTSAQSTNPNETLINTTANPIDVVYIFSITANGCSNTQSVTVRVKPIPTLSSTLSPAAICSNSVFTYSPSSATNGSTFTWTRAAIAGISNAAVTTPQSSNPNESLINSTNSPIDVVYVYTITANGCSTTQNVTVRVNPRPILSSTLSPAEICSNTAFTYTPTSNLGGAIFTWTRAAVAGISNPAVMTAQSSNPNETLVNTTSNPINVVYVYTITANGCSNTQNVTVVVKPTPSLSSSLSPAAICSGSAFTYAPTSAASGATFTWTRAAVAGISNTAVTAPQSSNPNEILVNTTANPINVVYAYTITADGCSTSQNVTVSVRPLPTLSSTLTPAAVCSNTAFTYTATTATASPSFSWTRPVIAGISNGAGSGSTATINETLVNTTAGPIDVVYTYSITANGCTNTQNVTVRINPTPAINPATIPISICTGGTFTFTPANGTNGIVPAGTSYSWTTSSQSGISGATSGSGSSITGTLTNSNTTTPRTATYTVTPSFGGCSGPTFQVIITVNPIPTVSAVSNQTRCDGASTAGITFTGSSVTGTVYNWTNNNPSIGLPASGTGTIAPFTASNDGVTPVTATITVTPVVNGCAGTARTFTITVNPSPRVTIVPDYCVAGGRVQLAASSNVPGTTWLWSTGQTTSSILVDLAGSYTVTATSPSGCATTATSGIAQELVVDGSFTNFNPASPSFVTEYTQNQNFYTGVGTSGLWPEGFYSVNTSANSPSNGVGYHPNFFGRDHTNNSVGPRNFLMVNGSTSTIPDPPNPNRQRIIWQQTVNVEPNTEYYFSAWAMNLNPASPARLQFEVNGVLVGTVADLSTAPTPTSDGQVNLSNWVRFYSDPTWNSGTATTAVIRIRNLNTTGGGNDFGLDDISFGTLSTFIRLTSAAGTDNQTVCNNSPITDITYTVGSGILGPDVIGLPPGITPIWNGVTLRFSGSPTASGTFNYTITTAGSCAPATATGTIIVRSTTTPGVISTNQTICSGGDPAAFVNTTAGTGDGVITYRWELNTNLTTPNWTTIAGQTGATYDVPSGLATTSQYRRVTIATSGSLICESVPTAPIQVTVQTVPTAGAIAAAQTICSGGDPVAFSSTTVGTGDGTITYRWESRVGSGSWITISGASGATFDAPAGLTQTTEYRRITVSTLNSVACESAPTAPIQVTVQAVVNAGAIAAAQTICTGGNPAAFTSTTPGGGDGTITYRWESRVGSGSWAAISGAIGDTYDVPAGLTQTTEYRRITISTLNSVACESAPTTPVTITILPENTVTPVTPNPALCLDTASPIIIIHTVTGATGITPQSASVDWNLPNGVTPTLSGGQLTIQGTPTEFGVFNYTIPLTGGCGSVSAIGTITVENPNYPITSIAVVNPTSLPGSSSFTVFSPNMTPGTYEIRYSTNGVNGGANNVLTTVVVSTSGQFTLTSPSYSNEGTTVLTINSIQKTVPLAEADPCAYFPPNNNTAIYGFGCSSESLQAGGNDAFFVPADVFQLTIFAYGDGSPSQSQTIPVIPGGVINIGVVGNVMFAATAPVASATPADYIVSAIGPNGRIVIQYDCSPPPPCNGPGNVYQYTDSEGYTIIRVTGDCSSWTWSPPNGLDEFEVLVVGGGGGGGYGEAAGGGGGGSVIYRQYLGITMNGNPGFTGASFTMTPGEHGLGAPSASVSGGQGEASTFTGSAFNSSNNGAFATLNAAGGGGGGSSSATSGIRQGGSGASGGGGAAQGTNESTGGNGYAGHNGGAALGETFGSAGAGGGGELSSGGNGTGTSSVMTAGSGGNGEIQPISGENISYGAGGGGTSSGAISNIEGKGGSQYTVNSILYYAGGNGNNNGIGVQASTYGSGGGAGRLGGSPGFQGVVYIRYPNFRILPVDYLYFNAVYNSMTRSGDLTWATAKEWENDRFEIERSVNTVKDWETIGEIQGAGFSDKPINYAYQDLKLPLAGGNIFYRLKQLNFAGDSTFSDTKAIKVEALPGTSFWRVYPNPTSGTPFNIEWMNKMSFEDEKITLRAIAPTGQFQVFQVEDIPGMGSLISEWFKTKAAGIYTIEIAWGEKREYHKVILKR